MAAGLPAADVEVGTGSEAVNGSLPATVLDAGTLTESANAQQQTLGQVTDSDALAFGETVDEPLPPVPTPPERIATGAGIRRLRMPPFAVRARESGSVAESAQASLYDVPIPWTPDLENDEAFLIAMLSA